MRAVLRTLALFALAAPVAPPATPASAPLARRSGQPERVSRPTDTAAPRDIAWEGWSDAAFARAAREDRFVLLDLGAVWCHWCHVMEETTYQDPEVVRLIAARFVAVRVDQDARPDLSNRYEDYGWPATIVFDAKGAELVKFAGYVPPARMASLLQAIIDDPTPGPSVRGEGASPTPPEGGPGADLREELGQLLLSRYDAEHGGWGFAKKYLDWDAVEWSLAEARRGDEGAERRARETLSAERKLIDPVWGGVYQYSDSGDWEHPHFEKLLAFQAENLRIYAMAWAQEHDPADLEAARAIRRYVRDFLTSPEGAFYVSQDADVVVGDISESSGAGQAKDSSKLSDISAEHAGQYFALPDAERQKRGLPRVDTHLYAREAAWGAFGLLALHTATGEDEPLRDALRAAHWILANRGLPDGGFRHDAVDAAGPYLGDTVAALRLFLGLYSATADRAWLAHAEGAARFIDLNFRGRDTPGFVTAKPAGLFDRTSPQRDENIAVARSVNLLFQYTGKADYKAEAEHAMRYLATPDVARRFGTGGVLLADRELRTEPLHVTIVGRLDDPLARALLLAAQAEPASYKRVELWDKRDGPLPRADVTYPQLAVAAAFVCTEGRCSAPAHTPLELRERVDRTLSTSGGARPSSPGNP